MNTEIGYKTIDLSGCEKLILGCIYEYHRKHEEAPNLKDILTMVEERYGIQWKLQTICTFFSRMEKKGLLSIKKNGRYSYYYPVMKYDEYVASELGGICKMYFEGDMKQMKRFVRQM